MTEPEMTSQVGERLRQLAVTQPEPLKSQLIAAADALVQTSVEFANRVQVILLRAELDIEKAVQRKPNGQ
jgi:hypothetical protein